MKLQNNSTASIASILITTILMSACASTSILDQITSGLSTNKNKPRPMIDTSKEAKLNIPYRSLSTSKDLSLIAFGSCSDQKLEQPLWSTISKNNPDLFIMMGDNVYASSATDKPIIDQYIKLNENVDYKKLRENVPFMATWDDHDYGQNDGGFDNIEKDEARRVFLNYWGYLKHTIPTDQKAIYHSRIVGSKNKKVQIIMLDTRWDRSPLVKNPDYNSETNKEQPPKIYITNTDPKARILSDEQWKWLEQELKKPAQLRLIVSSIQVIANDHYFEKWGNFPNERDRLFKLLQKHKVKNAVILSGDRHLASIAKTELKGLGTIYDITASALNRPSRALVPENDSSYTSSSFLKINFGLAEINWSNRTVNFKIIDENNEPQLQQTVRF